MTKGVTINAESELYVVPLGSGEPGGYSCLGFDVCLSRSRGISEWLAGNGRPSNPPGKGERGTLEAYLKYQVLLALGRELYAATGKRCPADLTPQLVGMEGSRVEVVDCHGEKRRFIVGKSTGWSPCHLEVARRDSPGGGAVTGAPFRSVRVIAVRVR